MHFRIQPTCDAQITAYTPLNTVHNPDSHIDAYLHLSHIKNTKNNISPTNSIIPQFLSSIFSSTDSYFNLRPAVEGLRSVFTGKKYKPVAQKICAVLADLPEKFCIIRNIVGDPLADMPTLPKIPPPFEPSEQYTLCYGNIRTPIFSLYVDPHFLLRPLPRFLHTVTSFPSSVSLTHTYALVPAYLPTASQHMLSCT